MTEIEIMSVFRLEDGALSAPPIPQPCLGPWAKSLAIYLSLPHGSKCEAVGQVRVMG